MTRLTSQQRKLVYLAGIVVLLVPIIWLGVPASGEEQAGGRLAQLRQTHDLGQSTLGDVDPTSAAMNLVLVGLRGVAVNLLWMEHEELQKTKQWAEMQATTESIILLQPHFKKVWHHHGWNLAYNVSAQWDDVRDRYYWVKEGIKFTQRGIRRNQTYADLYFYVAQWFDHKIGKSDEWRYFRKYFNPQAYPGDPNAGDPEFEDGPREGQPDPELNPKGEDNFLVAKRWHHRANDVEEQHGQDVMMRMLFRRGPVMDQLSYAKTLQREGRFGDKTRYAWRRGFLDLTQQYDNRDRDPGFGREEFESPGGTVILEATEEDVLELAERDGVSVEDKRFWITRYQNTSRYHYWRTRAKVESEANTVEAHRDLYQGQQLYRESQFYPVTYEPAAGACDKLGSDALSENQQAILSVLCSADGALSYSRLVSQEAIAEQFPSQADNFLQVLRDQVDAGLVQRNVSPAQAKLESGMEKFETMLQRYPSLTSHRQTLSEGLKGFLYWRTIHQLNNDPIPEEHPLQDFVAKNQEVMRQLEREFRRESRR